MIRLGKYSFESKYWKGISGKAVSLITHLLEVDPTSRYTATEALESKWIKSIEVEKSDLEAHTLGNSVQSISKESIRLKSAVKAVQWLNRSKQISNSLAVSSLTVDGFDQLDIEA